MTDFIYPLELQKIFINIFAGDATYFTALAIFIIVSMAGFFRMTGMALGFSLMIFLMMFSDIVPMSLIVLVSIIGGLLVGYIIPKLVSR